MFTSIFFYFLASIAIASAIFVVLNRNAVYSAIALVLCFFSLAVIYLLLEAYVIAVLEVFIYFICDHAAQLGARRCVSIF